jgi:hypothetical protein
LEGCPFVVMRFNVGVGRQEPGSRAVIKVATVKWQIFAEFWNNFFQFSDSKVEGGIHTVGAGGAPIKVPSSCSQVVSPNFKIPVSHNNLESLNEGLDGYSTAKGRVTQKEGNSAQGVIGTDVGVH